MAAALGRRFEGKVVLVTGAGSRRHLILIGLPGAGKSTAGRLLAERLGTHCTDIDPIMVRATGLSIADLFGEEGEAAFRAREHQAVVQALALPPHVVAPGGGWAAQPGNLGDTSPAGFLIHLAVAPEAAALRLAGDDSRPLLAGASPAQQLADLAANRLPFYRQAAAEVEVTDRSPAQVADLLLAVARSQAGWA